MTLMERDLRSVVRPVSERRFLKVTVWILKLRNFDSIYSSDVLEAFTWVDNLPCVTFPYIQNKVYATYAGIPICVSVI